MSRGVALIEAAARILHSMCAATVPHVLGLLRQLLGCTS